MNILKWVLVIFVFLFLIGYCSVASAQDTPKFQQVSVGDASKVNGYCIDYAGVAKLLVEPEAEKRKCALEKDAQIETFKLETEKIIKQLEVEYKKKIEMCELMACKGAKDKTPYNWKWLAGSATVGVLVGVVSVFVIQSFR